MEWSGHDQGTQIASRQPEHGSGTDMSSKRVSTTNLLGFLRGSTLPFLVSFGRVPAMQSALCCSVCFSDCFKNESPIRTRKQTASQGLAVAVT